MHCMSPMVNMDMVEMDVVDMDMVCFFREIIKYICIIQKWKEFHLRTDLILEHLVLF